MEQKKLMLLGGLRYLLPVIEAAHAQGYYVITCDYLPDNIAHRYSDEYCNISIVDKEAVLQAARERKIDGIISFAVDPGVVTAAYVQEQLGLPAFGPFSSVEILQNKDRFRQFLRENGFNVPQAFAAGSMEEALAAAPKFRYPVIVKPTDSAGSKGVSRVDAAEQLVSALEEAFDHSISGRVIVEDFIEKAGCSSDSDCFSVNGRLEFVSFSAQRFDEQASNEYTPAAYSWPSTFTPAQEEELTAELQRLIFLLKMNSTVYNVETRIGRDGKPYIMEVSPRGGGNRLSEMLRYATGVDLITNAVRVAVGDAPVGLEQKGYDGHWAEVILHAGQSGTFEGVEVLPSFQGKVVETDLWVAPGDQVNAFRGANDAIGTLVVRFGSAEESDEQMKTIGRWLRINVRS